MEKYRKINLKLTPQRLAILEYLEVNKSHPSADQIYSEVKKRFPMTSFATVYKTLETLKGKGRIKELNIDADRRRYDTDVGYHHHLICLDCRKIVDIDIDLPINIPEDKKCSFDVKGNHIEFYGVCPECKREKNNQQ